MGGLLNITGPFDLVWRKRLQLRFSRLDERSENDTNDEDTNGDEGFLHFL